jgi:hypothetical protein
MLAAAGVGRSRRPPQVLFERIEPRRPLRPIRLQPRVKFDQQLGAEPVEAPLSVVADIHQPRVAQDLEMTGHAGLMHSYRHNQFTDRTLAVADGIEDLPPGGFGDRLQG